MKTASADNETRFQSTIIFYLTVKKLKTLWEFEKNLISMAYFVGLSFNSVKLTIIGNT